MDRLTRRLRRAERVCRTATLRMRHVDFARSTRSHTLTEATAGTMTYGVPRTVRRTRGPDRVPRPHAAGDRAENLADAGAVQLALPIEHRQASALDATLDNVRDRYGADSIKRAVLLGRDTGLEVPLLPEIEDRT